MDDLTNKVALVTGASRGIGRSIAIALAGAGCDVALGYRADKMAAADAVNEIKTLGRRAIALAFDVSEPDEARALVRTAEEQLGPLAVVVNNAGINKRKSLEELSSDDWDENIRVNLASAFYVTQAALPGLRSRRWGRIIMLSSVAAQTGGVIGPHYAASKAGLIGLMHSYSRILASEGITANAIAPALIETDMIKGNEAITPHLIPTGRFGRPDEVAGVALLLASNGFITGQTINVNGGWHMS